MVKLAKQSGIILVRNVYKQKQYFWTRAALAQQRQRKSKNMFFSNFQNCDYLYILQKALITYASIDIINPVTCIMRSTCGQIISIGIISKYFRATVPTLKRILYQNGNNLSEKKSKVRSLFGYHFLKRSLNRFQLCAMISKIAFIFDFIKKLSTNRGFIYSN